MEKNVVKPAFFGLLSRRERWGLSLKGWIVAVLTLTAAAVLFIFFVHPFLAVTQRVPSSILVVEGWVSTSGLRSAVGEFREGRYDIIYTTGGTTGWDAGSESDSDTYASVAAARLVGMGVPPERIKSVPSHLTIRDRTYASALALREWLQSSRSSFAGMNVVTEGTHSRRTRLIYEKTYGEGVPVGVISARNPEYDPGRWWESSEGLKEVLSESGAYLYARVLFRTKE
jgi:hypothetical protein